MPAWEGVGWFWSLRLSDLGLVLQTRRLGLGALSGNAGAPLPLPLSSRNERQMAGIEPGAAAGARTESALPAAPTPLLAGPPHASPFGCTPAPFCGGEGGATSPCHRRHAPILPTPRPLLRW